MEPEEEPGGAAVREVYEEAGVKGKLGRLLGIFENQDRKHRTYVYVLTVTEILEDWEDSVNIGRKREWFKVEDAIKVLQCHKPVHAEYLEKLKLSCSPTNGNSGVPPLPDNNSLCHFCTDFWVALYCEINIWITFLFVSSQQETSVITCRHLYNCQF